MILLRCAAKKGGEGILCQLAFDALHNRKIRLQKGKTPTTRVIGVCLFLLSAGNANSLVTVTEY